MQCTSTLDSGERCPLEAAPDAPTCPDHTPPPPSPPSPLDFYGRNLRPHDRAVLEAAAALNDTDAEVPLLRALITEAVGRRDYETAHRRIVSLARIISSRKPRRGDDQLTSWLNQALDELDAETGDPNVTHLARTGS